MGKEDQDWCWCEFYDELSRIRVYHWFGYRIFNKRYLVKEAFNWRFKYLCRGLLFKSDYGNLFGEKLATSKFGILRVITNHCHYKLWIVVRIIIDLTFWCALSLGKIICWSIICQSTSRVNYKVGIYTFKFWWGSSFYTVLMINIV